VISLKHRVDRQENVAKVLEGVQFEFFDGWNAKEEGLAATDAKLAELCPGKKNKWQRHSVMEKNMTDPANQALDLARKGCFISHMLVWRLARERKQNQIRIFEDDIKLHVSAEQLNNLPAPKIDSAFLLWLGWMWSKKCSASTGWEWGDGEDSHSPGVS
jgi:GR25 family glycosyltransferase involved in LPS biosynthesis